MRAAAGGRQKIAQHSGATLSDPVTVEDGEDTTEVLPLSRRVANFAARAAADNRARNQVHSPATEPGMAHRPLDADGLARLFGGVPDLPVSRCLPGLSPMGPMD